LPLISNVGAVITVFTFVGNWFAVLLKIINIVNRLHTIKAVDTSNSQ